jgi:hypothetical protein
MSEECQQDVAPAVANAAFDATREGVLSMPLPARRLAYFARFAVNSLAEPRPPSRFIWISSPAILPV